MQNITQKCKDRLTRTPLRTGVEIGVLRKGWHFFLQRKTYI